MLKKDNVEKDESCEHSPVKSKCPECCMDDVFNDTVLNNEFKSKCYGCGMPLRTGREYHPFLACQCFQYLQDGSQVEENLKAIFEYAYKAKDLGWTIKEAMNDITLVRSKKK